MGEQVLPQHLHHTAELSSSHEQDARVDPFGGWGTQFSQACGCESPLQRMPWDGKGKGNMPPHTLPVIGRRANLGDLRTEELALPLNQCNSPESRPCTLPEQNSGAGSGGANVSELDPKV